MARHKEFDVDVALDRALDLFWSNGFEATSMQDLVDHLGINRGSLYDTFGSKEELYRRAFDRYVAPPAGAADPLAASDLSVKERISAFLHSKVDGTDGRGCFVVNTACERNGLDDWSRSATAAAATATRDRIHNALVAAQTTGELNDDVAVDVIADVVYVVLEGLQVHSTIDPDRPRLHAVADAIVDRLL